MKKYAVRYLAGSSTFPQPLRKLDISLRNEGLFLNLLWLKELIKWDDVLRVSTEHQVSPGSVSKGGAVVGALLLGPAGAVIGGLKGKKSLSFLSVEYRKKNGEMGRLLFETPYAEAIKDKMDEQLTSRFGKSSRSQDEAQDRIRTEMIDSVQLEELARLKDKGIITEEEFVAKKKQLLGL